MSLLSPNDWDALSGALRRAEETSLVRTIGPYKVRASTVPAGKGWVVAMLVRVERWNPWWYETQYFESVEQARGMNGHQAVQGLSLLAKRERMQQG